MTETKGNIVVVTARLPREFHRSVAIKITQRGTSFQFVITEQLKRWLEERDDVSRETSTSGVHQKPDIQRVIAFPVGLAPQFKMLDDILKSGNQEAIDYATRGLKLAQQFITLGSAKRGKK